MNMVMGLVVRSIAGRDKGLYLIVTGLEGDAVYVCDGKHRPLEKPKKKNIKHLATTAITIPASSLKTNKQIRKALHPYNFGNDVLS